MKRDAAEIAELSRLIDAALELPAEARSTWIEQLPAANDTLKPALRKLLALQPAAGNTYTLSDVSRQVHLAMQGAVSSAEALEFKDGARVGPYELVRELGRGGMGTVWLARRTEGLTRRNVALKLPHAGMLHAEFAARMGRERDILESLAHPNIARLYDAGVTAAGQPYLALEYIEGVPINVYCDTKRLDVRQRIRLFVQVLQAIQYAHSHLVIHRDLKPANILVTDAGQAVVLDFGIAKLTVEGSTADTALTQFGGRALTPDYASPEQIAGAPLTTASDVYSLGVILYELLTGERPYKLARGSAAALEEAILAADVRRPSAATVDAAKAEARASTAAKLARTLRGDLDTIVLTALRIVLTERYRTVDAFTIDIDHFLGDRAILARPESWWEASRRFVSRHKLAVGSVSIVVLALAGGIAAATWQAAKARASEQRAIAAAATSDAVKQFLIRIFQTNTLNQADPMKAREKNALQLLEDGADRVAVEFKGNPALQREMLTVIVRMLGESRSSQVEKHTLELIALLKDVPGSGLQQADLYNELAIGYQGKDLKASKESAQAGLAALGASRDPAHRKMRAMLLTSYSVALTRGNESGVEAPLLEARDLLADGFTGTAEYGHVLSYLGWREVARDKVDAAVDYFERAMVAYQRDPTSFRRTIAQGHNDLSVAYGLRKRWAEEEAELETAAELFRKDYGDDDPETALATARAANAMALQNRYDKAIASLRSMIAILEKPSSNAAPDYLVSALEYLGNALVQSGRLKDAEPEVNRLRALAGKIVDPYYQINSNFIAAELAAMRGKAADAEAAARQAVNVVEQMYGAGTPHWARANNRLGRVLLDIGKLDEADALFAANLQKDAAHAAVYDSVWTAASVQHARVQIERGQARQAIPALAAALKEFLAQPANIRDLNEETELQLALGRALTAADQAAEARPHLERALELRKTQYAFSPRLAEAQIALADGQQRLGEIEASRALLAKARAIQAANPQLGPQYRKPLAALTARLAAGSH